MKRFTYEHYEEATTIETVLEQLKNLDDELALSDMHNLIAFNHTYFIITRNVYQKLGTGYFDDDSHMKSLDTCFGNYYFDALKSYVQDVPCPQAWTTLFESCKKNDAYQFIYMALGVNAHVNNDLPQTLCDVHARLAEKGDFDRINEVISKSIPEVIDSLHERQAVLTFFENALEGVYTWYLNSTIQKWRRNAWQQYIRLEKNEITVSQIEDDTAKNAEILAKITHLQNIPHLLKLH